MMKTCIALISLLLVSGASMAQDSFSSVEERMTGREFMETGLNKLSEQELATLNEWLRAHSIATLDAPRAGTRPAVDVTTTTPVANTAASTPPADDRGFTETKDDKATIVSRIAGEFTGWDGETIFRLENGMVWKQAQTDKFFTKAMTNPQVEIKSGMFGAWRLSVEGYNKSVKVERLQ